MLFPWVRRMLDRGIEMDYEDDFPAFTGLVAVGFRIGDLAGDLGGALPLITSGICGTNGLSGLRGLGSFAAFAGVNGRISLPLSRNCA